MFFFFLFPVLSYPLIFPPNKIIYEDENIYLKKQKIAKNKNKQYFHHRKFNIQDKPTTGKSMNL